MTLKQSYSTAWKSPSNIALVKYWGKFGRQYPSNPSISFTLSEAYSNLVMKVNPADRLSCRLEFHGQRETAFEERILRFLESIQDDYPWLEHASIDMSSTNSFPHSAGIASSASAMSALALCLVDIDQQIQHQTWEDSDDFRQRSSEVARLASGSAARSVYPFLARWGVSTISNNGSNNHADYAGNNIDPIFSDYKNSILILSSATKSVSSSAGHRLMAGNRFASERFKQANENLEQLLLAMRQGDMPSFIRIVEEEALTLHALMMTSSPSYILMEPQTIEAVRAIRSFREENDIPVCFTLDAGPNIHMLYPASCAGQVEPWRDTVLRPLCEGGRIIEDHVGQGPQRISF